MISFFLNALSESDSWSMRWKDQTQWIEMISFFLMLEVNQTDFNILWPAFGLLMKILTHFDFSQGSKYPRLDLVSMFRHNQSCKRCLELQEDVQRYLMDLMVLKVSYNNRRKPFKPSKVNEILLANHIAGFFHHYYLGSNNICIFMEGIPSAKA